MSEDIRQISDLIHQSSAPSTDLSDIAATPSLSDAEPSPVETATAPQETVQSASTVITVCPACGRKLLSLRSILCNWCGSKIADVRYQQQAAAERAQLDAELRQAVEEEQRMIAQYGVLGKIKRAAKNRGANPVLAPSKDDLIRKA